ncbi:efflux transporter outer membrane subunit [Pseudomonas matsuisoli]|uniref:RND transporter n=1 Tax=Pseudomonas matsuisoli TaxID=1515666 RepID=A0A917Q3G9_9PSED|nr:efflux transporter outer membrane subunit [Pseudomonas matsuisoli]GGK09651.1 RND transporter [Pseudomonas matsuisoli]
MTRRSHLSRRSQGLLAVSLSLFLTACQTVGPDYHLPEGAAVQRADLQGNLSGGSGNVVSAPMPSNWWQLYRDPQLDDLIARALASNADLRVAAANLARSRAGVDEARDAGGFTHSAKAGGQRLQESGEAFLLTDKVPVANVADLSVSTSYQFDLFGVLERGVESAEATADAAQAAADLSRITIAADVARSYVQVCAANEELHIAENALDLQQQSLDLTRRLREAGRGNETAVIRSQTQFKSLRADLPRYEAERQTGLYRLAMLLAVPVDQLPAGIDQCSTLPKITQPLPVGDGAELLKRRPDIRQAERQLAAATARIGVATGELYPDISIGATVGAVGIVDNIGKPATRRWGFGPLISWTVPANGARARIAQAEASSQAALAHFDGVVLNAVREAQTSLSQYDASLQRRDALADAAQSAEKAAQQTREFYQAGRESFVADLEATRALTDIHAQLAAAETQVAVSQVNLFLALGGGWEQQ